MFDVTSGWYNIHHAQSPIVNVFVPHRPWSDPQVGLDRGASPCGPLQQTPGYEKGSKGFHLDGLGQGPVNTAISGSS
jgi:hypothetical protein